jgi:hypothetical protein
MLKQRVNDLVGLCLGSDLGCITTLHLFAIRKETHELTYQYSKCAASEYVNAKVVGNTAKSHIVDRFGEKVRGLTLDLLFSPDVRGRVKFYERKAATAEFMKQVHAEFPEVHTKIVDWQCRGSVPSASRSRETAREMCRAVMRKYVEDHL